MCVGEAQNVWGGGVVTPETPYPRSVPEQGHEHWQMLHMEKSQTTFAKTSTLHHKIDKTYWFLLNKENVYSLQQEYIIKREGECPTLV